MYIIEEKPIPNYTFLCENAKCGHKIESFQSMANYKPLEICPYCKKKSLIRDFNADLPTGSVLKGDNEITLGHLAERNTERFSDDKKEFLHNKNHAYMEKPPKFKKSKDRPTKRKRKNG